MERGGSGTTDSAAQPAPLTGLGSHAPARSSANDRRHSYRVPVVGRASIWRRHKLHGHYALHDLSIAGCALRDGPHCILGEHVELVLHLPEQPALWLSAEVRRNDDCALALRFARTDPQIEDRLQDLVVEVYTRMHVDNDSFSLVIDPRSTARRVLVHRLDAVGERAIGVATPLDAVQLLLERGESIQTAFIGSDRPDAPSFELVEFLARNYPRVRRVLMGDAQEVADAWLAEANGEVHGLLETPCSEEVLRKLVHRIASLPEAELS